MVLRGLWQVGPRGPGEGTPPHHGGTRVREEMRKRMHHGMTIVTTQTASKTEHRTGKDFVVIDGIY